MQSGRRQGQTLDVLLVATSANSLYAFAEDELLAGNANPLWSRKLSSPLIRPGSNIPYPLGICSTPVIDRQSGRIFALAFQDVGGTLFDWNFVGNTTGRDGWINLGQVGDARHHFWTGHFEGSSRTELLFYYEGDGNWWLGICDASLRWKPVGNTLGKVAGEPNFGQVWDGRPFWTGQFSEVAKTEIMFYTPGDGNWWLGSMSSERLHWNLIGNTLGANPGDPNFGQVWDGHHNFWIGDFNGDRKTDVLFYYQNDDNWWLGTLDEENHLNWAQVGNTIGFGHNISDGRPFWVGSFSSPDKSQVLFYYPGDSNWWLGTINEGQLQWALVGNTAGFGNLNDGHHHFWTGHFTGSPLTELLFYFENDGNWWLGVYDSNQRKFAWTRVSNTLGKYGGPFFDQVWDGRPFWTGHFSGTRKTEIIFYTPADGNWWVGSYDDSLKSFRWTLVVNTLGRVAGQPNFGQVWDGNYRFWSGDFTGSSRTELIFYFEGDGNWWFGSLAHGEYYIYSIDVNSGNTLQCSLLYDPGELGRPAFTGRLLDQRGALNLVSGSIYATFADFAAWDLGRYHGWVVKVKADNLCDQKYYSVTRNVLGGGLWGPGGVAADNNNSLYIATGNSPLPNDSYWQSLTGVHPAEVGDYFEAVVKLDSDLRVVDWYMPTDAQDLNDRDLDLGGSSILDLPSINGREMLVLTGKDGRVYLLDRLNLGHWGGELWRRHVFFENSNDAESKSAPAYFLDKDTQTHYVYVVGSGTPGLVAYKVIASATGASLQLAWKANTKAGIRLGDAPGSPTVLSRPDSSHASVWIVDDATEVLRAFDALTGAEVYNSSVRPGDALGAVPHFPPITCGKSSVFVGTQYGVACYGSP